MGAHEWLVEASGGVLDRVDARRIRSKTYYGQDLVPRPRRLALMNLYLHGVEPHIYLGDSIYEPDRGERYLDTIYSESWVADHFGDVTHLWNDVHASRRAEASR